MSIEKATTNENTNIKHIIAVMSGKGGVGKSSVTGLLALELQELGYKVGILDGDITGPSIPKIFGLKGKKASYAELGIFPIKTVSDIPIISINLLLNNEDDAVIWRGPLIGKTVKQFYTDVVWGDLDYLLIDLPPGTGDVPLTIMQFLPVDGIVIVTTPQELVSMIVKKSINMARNMNVPVLGLIENMGYVQCPHCEERIYPFGEGKTDEVAAQMGIEVLVKLPIDPEFATMSDEGRIEIYSKMNSPLENVGEYIRKKMEGNANEDMCL